MPDQLDQAVALASQLLGRGMLSAADLLVRMGMEEWGERASGLNLLGQVAMAVREPELGAEWFARAKAIDPYFKPAARNLAAAERERSAQPGPGSDAWRRESLANGRPAGYLVIRAWGAGFFADVDHVLGNLLLAEITGRVPIVIWGANSRWSVPGLAEAWTAYFAPVSGLCAEQLAGKGFFPSHWSAPNIAGPNINRWAGPGSRLGGPALLNRSEEVVVADFASPVAQMRGWLPRGHADRGRGTLQTFRSLVERYVRIAPDIAAEIDRYWAEHLAGAPTMAVHVRGGDKVTEVPDLDRVNASYTALVDRALDAEPGLRIFLLTDSAEVAAEFGHRYGSRVIAAPCERVSGRAGVHLGVGGDRLRLGIEVIRDVYLAARCDRFIGLGSSNVSCMVQHLKDWPAGSCDLLGRNLSLRPPLDIHLPGPAPGAQ